MCRHTHRETDTLDLTAALENGTIWEMLVRPRLYDLGYSPDVRETKQKVTNLS